MFCGRCGFANPDTDCFCVSCGGPIQITETPVGSITPAQFAQPITTMQQPMQSGASSSLAPRKLSLGGAIQHYFTNYMNFKGRASRSEYWFFYLFGIIACLVAALLSPILHVLVIFVLFIPYIAVLTRRLHDTGRAGPMPFIVLIPLVGPILLLVWECTEGEKTLNKYGPPW